MHKDKYFIYSDIAQKIISAIDKNESTIDVSTDLNMTIKKYELDQGQIIFDKNNRLGLKELNKIKKKHNKIFVLDSSDELNVLEEWNGAHYKLVPTSTAPYLEINGVKMHISKGVCPYESAGQMAKQVVKNGHRVLDTCTGLGYAASTALDCGAREIVTVEKSPNVSSLREQNPWSQKIYCERASLVSGDSNGYIATLGTGSFDSIIHDPPRFSLAGELYSEKFYSEMFRVLKPNSSLFHYTGNPNNKGRGKNFLKNCIRRLKSAGFKQVTYIEKIMGFVATK